MPTKTFFDVKEDWSKIKDDLLSSYLLVYFTKILRTQKPILYIDCFAGKGKFDDNEEGSPLIAISKIKEAIGISTIEQFNIKCFFIESKYSNDLKINLHNVLREEERKYFQIFNGLYENEIKSIIKNNPNAQLFLYIDPFGIKNLHFDTFELLKGKNYSREILLNLNSFGFIREACRLLKVESNNDFLNSFCEREDLEPPKNKTANSIENMNKVANGDYWQELIMKYKNKELNAHDTENCFVNMYCQQLESVFKYVINIPIKARKMTNMPKYRMIFATNHTHGMIEMASNMNKRWNEMKEKHEGGQISLFEYDLNSFGKFINTDLESEVMSILTTEDVPYDIFLCRCIKQFSIFRSIKDIRAIIEKCEKEKSIVVSRKESTTKSGKPSTFIDYKKDMKVRKKT